VTTGLAATDAVTPVCPAGAKSDCSFGSTGEMTAVAWEYLPDARGCEAPGAVAAMACTAVGTPTGTDSRRCVVTSDWLCCCDEASSAGLGAAALVVLKGLNSGDLTDVNIWVFCIIGDGLAMTVTTHSGSRSLDDTKFCGPKA